MSWTPLDPYSNPEDGTGEPLTGAALIREVAFHKETARQNGTPIDPEWDQWLADDPDASAILAKLRAR